MNAEKIFSLAQAFTPEEVEPMIHTLLQEVFLALALAGHLVDDEEKAP